MRYAPAAGQVRAPLPLPMKQIASVPLNAVLDVRVLVDNADAALHNVGVVVAVGRCMYMLAAWAFACDVNELLVSGHTHRWFVVFVAVPLVLVVCDSDVVVVVVVLAEHVVAVVVEKDAEAKGWSARCKLVAVSSDGHDIVDVDAVVTVSVFDHVVVVVQGEHPPDAFANPDESGVVLVQYPARTQVIVVVARVAQLDLVDELG